MELMKTQMLNRKQLLFSLIDFFRPSRLAGFDLLKKTFDFSNNWLNNPLIAIIGEIPEGMGFNCFITTIKLMKV